MSKIIKQRLLGLLLAVTLVFGCILPAAAQDLVYVTNGAAQRYSAGSVLVINGRASEAGLPLSNLTIIIDIKDSSNKVVYYGQVKTNSTGYFKTNFTIPAGVSGAMTVKLSTNEGEKVNEDCFTLFEKSSSGYKAINSSVELSTDETSLISGITFFPGIALADQKNQRRNVIYVVPAQALKANTTYKIVVDKDLSSNNSSTLGSNVEIFFTTEIASSGGGSSNSNTGVPPVNNVVDTQTTINGSTVTASVKAADITSAMAQSAAEAAKTGAAAKVTLNVAAPENTRNVQLSVPTATLSAVASSDVIALTVATPVANIDFDSKSLEAIAGAATGDEVKISANVVDPTTLAEDIQARIQGSPVFDFTVTSGSNTISNFNGGQVTITVPYALKAGENPNAIVVYFLTENGDLQTVTNRYDAATGKVKMILSHFSKYVVGYNRVTFKDVASSAWYADSVDFVSARNIFGGVGEQKFAPDDPMTRAMFARVIANLEGVDLSAYHTSVFADVDAEAWYGPAIAWAAEKKIINGIGQGKFAPDLEITREQMAVMLNNYIDYKSLTLVAVASNSFADSTDISSWAKTGVDKVQSYGIISGVGNNKFAPQDTANRAQVATILANFVKAITI